MMTTTQQAAAAAAQRSSGIFAVYSSVQQVPRPTGGYIADLAGYKLESSTGLVHAIREFERLVKAPVYVVTLPSIGVPKSGVKHYATRLFNEWKIGSRGTQKGVLVLIVKDVRRIEIEVGRHLNSIVSRSWTTHMLERDVLPWLREGAYAGGIERAISRLSVRIHHGGTPLPISWYRSPGFWMSPLKTEEAEDALTALTYGVGVSLLAIGYGTNAIASNRRGRTCDACGSVVIQGVVSEGPPGHNLTTDNFRALGLDPALSLSHKLTIRHRLDRIGKWRTVLYPSYERQGRRERKLHCHKCGAVSTKVRIIPRLVDISSSDSGSDCSSDGGGGGGGDF